MGKKCCHFILLARSVHAFSNQCTVISQSTGLREALTGLGRPSIGRFERSTISFNASTGLNSRSTGLWSNRTTGFWQHAPVRSHLKQIRIHITAAFEQSTSVLSIQKSGFIHLKPIRIHLTGMRGRLTTVRRRSTALDGQLTGRHAFLTSPNGRVNGIDAYRWLHRPEWQCCERHCTTQGPFGDPCWDLREG